jgi:hypothetical protein
VAELKECYRASRWGERRERKVGFVRLKPPKIRMQHRMTNSCTYMYGEDSAHVAMVCR